MSSRIQPAPPPTSGATRASAANPMRRAREARRMRLQKVDIVASLLLSALVVIGMLVLLLFVVWLTQTFTWQAGDIKIGQERIAGRGDHAEGVERDIEPPGAEEMAELSEPTLAESLEAATNMASSLAASLDFIDSSAELTRLGAGRGDSRPAGPLGEGADVVPRFERWELKFQAKGLKPYAAQLDFYNIELACVGGGVPTVDYAFSLAGTPQKRSGTSVEENRQTRLYFMWRQDGPLKQFDRQLLEQAGIRTQGRQLLKFIPKELEEQLAQIEMKYAIARGHNQVKEIAKTIFESQASAMGGYAFVVIEQFYRTPRE